MEKFLTPSIDKVLWTYVLNLSVVILFPILGYIDITIAGVVVVYLVFFTMNVLGITCTFHRYLSHKAFKFKHHWLRKLFILFGTLSCSGSPIGWVLIHRDHHKYSDTTYDPHQGTLGFWKLQAVRYNINTKQYQSDVRDIIADKFCMALHKYYFIVIGSYALLLYAILGVEGVYYGFFAPAALTLFAENLTNWAAHQPFGYSTFDVENKSRNVWWLNILSHGDGWHNNHHKYPSSSTTHYKWWELDVTGKIIEHVKLPS
jgi:fatty-acid desaturase